MKTPYSVAQRAMADLKGAVYEMLATAPNEGITNASLGRMLGIHTGHVRHEGHIPRTILAIMESEGVVEQDKTTKKWRIKDHTSGTEA